MNSLTCIGLAALLAAGGASAAPLRSLEAKGKHEATWQAHPVRTLADVSPLSADGTLTEYGGLKTAGDAKVTGFFHTEKIGGRWWLVDPAGGLFLCKGINSVAPGRTSGAKDALKKKFGDEAGWARQTTAALREHGFNTVGAWSDYPALRGTEHPAAQTKLWSFMSSYGKQRGGTHMEAGHTGYLNDAIFVFDPDFEEFCDEHAKQLAEAKNDPWLLGHFSDNELPLKRSCLRGYLTLPTSEPGYVASWDWLRSKHGASAALASVTKDDEAEFLAVVAERYFKIVSAAIRKYDPNHLYLGARCHSAVYDFPEVFKACGPYVDVVSVNYYFAWTPDPAKLAMWAAQSGRPVMITEWYAKGEDSGMANTGGAGWLVHTQRDRGAFYQHFALSLLESPVCVGWHWFRYADNDPDDKTVDPSNRDSNKGIVNSRYEPWADLLETMKPLNNRAYGLINYFNHTRRP